MPQPTIAAPHPGLLALEFARGALEYGAGWLMSGAMAKRCARGDGHPVVVYPGLGTTDSSTTMLRDFLKSLGYAVSPWGRGMNTGPSRTSFDAMLGELLDDVRDLSEAHETSVTLIGWSLGGVYAREIAKLDPKVVRQVVTLGTPFRGTAEATNGRLLFELLSGSDCHKDPRLQRRLAKTPSVPTTSIYSRTDGVVAWECSLNPSLAHAENIEITAASHLGLISNPAVYRVLADRLAQPAGAWRPWSPSSFEAASVGEKLAPGT